MVLGLLLVLTKAQFFLGNEEGAYTKVEHKEDVLEAFPEDEEVDEVQSETEDVRKEPPSILVIMSADAPESPSPRTSHILSDSAALGSTSFSHHYSRLKSTKVAQTLVGFSAPTS